MTSQFTNAFDRRWRKDAPNHFRLNSAATARSKQQGFDRDPVTEGMNGTEAVPGWGRNRANLRSILTLNSRVAFYEWPICPTTRSTASAAMKQPFGAKSAESCLRSMLWIAANPRREDAVSVSAAYKNCRPTRVMTVDFQRRPVAAWLDSTASPHEVLSLCGSDPSAICWWCYDDVRNWRDRRLLR